jgi:hypothetical protein
MSKPPSTASLDAKAKTELRKIAKDLGVDSDTATKPELIQAIQRRSK